MQPINLRQSAKWRLTTTGWYPLFPILDKDDLLPVSPSQTVLILRNHNYSWDSSPSFPCKKEARGRLTRYESSRRFFKVLFTVLHCFSVDLHPGRKTITQNTFLDFENLLISLHTFILFRRKRTIHPSMHTSWHRVRNPRRLRENFPLMVWSSPFETLISLSTTWASIEPPFSIIGRYDPGPSFSNGCLVIKVGVRVTVLQTSYNTAFRVIIFFTHHLFKALLEFEFLTNLLTSAR